MKLLELRCTGLLRETKKSKMGKEMQQHSTARKIKVEEVSWIIIKGLVVRCEAV